MNEIVLAKLLARIDRLERLLVKFYDHSGCSDEMHQLRSQLYEESRTWPQMDETHLEAARRMIEANEKTESDSGTDI